MSWRKDIKDLPMPERRRLLKWASSLIAAPLVPAGARWALTDLLLGAREALADDSALPTLFLEINLRDQWDFGHLMVAPGLATASQLIRGETGWKAAVYYDQSQLTACSNNVFLTPDSLALRPHVDSVAMMELGELALGTIHGHEAANALRSPGRSYNGGLGRLPMWLNDPHTKIGGNENHYSSTPTPFCIHNFYQKQLDTQLQNGIAIKGISRSIATAYHFGGTLSDAEPDRYWEIDKIERNLTTMTKNIALDNRTANIMAGMLRQADLEYMRQQRYSTQEVANHSQYLDNLAADLYRPDNPSSIGLDLTPAEILYWQTDVPPQHASTPKIPIWQQCGYAAKLLCLGLVRSVALEFDYEDVHDTRPANMMSIMGRQVALPLARLIETFKAAGVYDRTVIAIYNLDGGRSPAAGSSGDVGKCCVVLAGGGIKGGYYGDIRPGEPYQDGQKYVYHRPDDDTGAPVAVGTTAGDARVPGANVWRTVMKALQIPDSLAGSFPDVADARPLRYFTS